MGGTFRFMTYFVKVMTFLCASAYKGAKVYSLMHVLQAQDLYRNCMFHLKLRHCLNSYPCSKQVIPHYYHYYFVIAPANNALHALGVKDI